jgi:putative FmdB family regulatory protein
MPTYEYQCAEGHTFEQIQKMSDPPIGTCPVCGAAAERRVSGGSGLIFKGSGFYITDYGKDGKGPRKEPESSSPTAPASPAAPAAPAASAGTGGSTAAAE